MKRLFIPALIAGLILGGYNCNRSTEKTGESLSIEESGSELDPMEKELFEEEKQFETQNDLLRQWEQPEDDIPEEELGN
jgi:hypothetical protein